MAVTISSYNCNSLRSNIYNVHNILENADIICLQELMLCKSDLHILNELNDNFENISYVLDREAEGIVEGRPTKGVAILWNKSLSSFVSPVMIDDSMIGILLSNNGCRVLLLNVYLPCDYQNNDALENYRFMLAKLDAVIKEQNVNNVIVTGDFNADPTKGRFWQELDSFMKCFSFNVLDEQLPHDTFTYLCPA